MKFTSRRGLLHAVGSGAGLAIAGCLSGGPTTPRYQLSARNVPGSLTDAFRWRPRGRFPEADQELMNRLVTEGSLTTAGFALYPSGRDEQRYVERDGTYYEVSIERTGTVERERWILWFDILDGEPPADAEVFTSSLGTGDPTDLRAAYGLAELDVRVVEDAAGQIPREGFDFHDPESDPPGRRGHVFLRRDAAGTDLLPEPPFTHVAFETGDGTRYARAVTERVTVELQLYEHGVVEVADSTDEYADSVREKHLAATFDRRQLPGEQREILDAITAGGGRYEERPPQSDAMGTVLDRLGLADVGTPQPNGVEFSDDVYFRYRESYFSAQLQVFR